MRSSQNSSFRTRSSSFAEPRATDNSVELDEIRVMRKSPTIEAVTLDVAKRRIRRRNEKRRGLFE